MTFNTSLSSNESRTELISARQAGLYKAAGLVALLAVLVALADISLTFFPAGAEQPGTMSAVDWFELFRSNWFFGLRNLGLLPNILTLTLLIPLFLALYAAHRKTDPGYGALALIVALAGTTIYLSNNAAFAMLALSSKYAAASTEAQRAMLAAAGEAILARGEDFTPGSFIGILLGEVAMMMISWVMLHGGIFNKATACCGFLAGLFLTVFTVWSTFIPVEFEASMIVAMLGGLFSIAWYILTARRFFYMAGHMSEEK